jgi:DNA-binding beta-propeller fold protein YncE
MWGGVTAAMAVFALVACSGTHKKKHDRGAAAPGESKPSDAKAGAPAAPKKAELLIALPDYCNTPDGMAIFPDNSFLISMPNFNDETVPPLIMKITADNKAEKFYEFPTPYPGLDKGVDRIGPMGMARDPQSGNVYLADMQYMKDKNQKSRMWKVVIKDGKFDKLVLVAKGFNVANGIAIRGEYAYITESVLEEGFNPTLKSAVLKFKLDEENVTLKTPLTDDPHIIATFESSNKDWGFGADGIAFDSKGNLFVGLFGDGKMFKVEFDKDGKVVSNKLFAEAPGKLINCDGMSCDVRTDKLYVADSAANAIQVIAPDGTLTTLAQNEDTTDKTTGMLDQPCEALLRGDTIVSSNMDWPFPKFRNTKHQQPATLSVIKLDGR